jgi:hypothetical protein
MDEELFPHVSRPSRSAKRPLYSSRGGNDFSHLALAAYFTENEEPPNRTKSILKT